MTLQATPGRRWALYEPGTTDRIEESLDAGTTDFREDATRCGFPDEVVANASYIRVWHPYYRDGLSSFIYHYHDLVDRTGEIVAQYLDAEDIREG